MTRLASPGIASATHEPVTQTQIPRLPHIMGIMTTEFNQNIDFMAIFILTCSLQFILNT